MEQALDTSDYSISAESGKHNRCQVRPDHVFFNDIGECHLDYQIMRVTKWKCHI